MIAEPALARQLHIVQTKHKEDVVAELGEACDVGFQGEIRVDLLTKDQAW